MKKHILFIVENNAVPYDVRVWAEAKTAKSLGYEVTVISPQGDLARKSYEVINGIEVYRHPMPGERKGTIGFMYEYASAFFWEFLLSLKIYLKKPFQIIHAANPPDHIFLLALFFKIFHTKFIFDHHDLSPELYLSKFPGNKNILYHILLAMEKLSCKTANAVISTNQSYRKIITKRHKILSEKIFVVRNDPNITNYVKSKNCVSEFDNEAIKILYLGSINPQDGVEILVRVVNILVHEFEERNICCIIIGDGASLYDVKKIVHTLKLKPYIDFKGFIHDRNIIIKYLYSSDICVETAPDNEVNRYSTFIKIMEYMAAEKPIVAFDLQETRYSANNSALLVEPGDVQGFAESVKKLIDNPKLRKEIGKNGVERVREKHNWQNAAMNLRKAYDFLF